MELRDLSCPRTEPDFWDSVPVLNGAWIPSMAEELETEVITPRSRAARSRRYGLVWESLVELMGISIAADVGQTPKGQRGT